MWETGSSVGEVQQKLNKEMDLQQGVQVGPDKPEGFYYFWAVSTNTV